MIDQMMTVMSESVGFYYFFFLNWIERVFLRCVVEKRFSLATGFPASKHTLSHSQDTNDQRIYGVGSKPTRIEGGRVARLVETLRLAHGSLDSQRANVLPVLLSRK